MLEVRDLNINYRNKSILKSINFTLQDSTLNIMLGLNGAGKSTLFKALIGALGINSGKIMLENIDITNLSPKYRSKLISYIPQNLSFAFDYKVSEVISMGLEAHFSLFDTISKSHKIKIKNVLERLNLAHKLDYNINTLSGGEAAIVMLGRALVQDSKVLLFDEPTAHLDIKNQQLFFNTIKNLKDKIILINIHDPSLALDYGDNILALKNGEILFNKARGNLLKEDLESVYDIEINFHKIKDSYYIKANNQ